MEGIGSQDGRGAGGRLSGRVALITGSSSGIGAACAARFAEEGACVLGFDLQPGQDDRWSQAVARSPDAAFHQGDVRDVDALESAVQSVVDRFGGLHVLVNAAGVAGGGPVHLMAPEEWDRVVDVNLKGTFLACRAVLPTMIAARRGSVVNVASVEGIEGFEGGSAYNASKGGVVLLTRNMAIDYARVGVRVNALCPGFVETPLFESIWKNPGLDAFREQIRDAHQLGRFGLPEEIANAALFLASDESSFVTGHALVVDGGYTAGHRHGIARLMGLE